MAQKMTVKHDAILGLNLRGSLPEDTSGITWELRIKIKESISITLLLKHGIV